MIPDEILNRFTGENFILYGQDEEIKDQLESRGKLIAWFGEWKDDPPKVSYEKFLKRGYNAIYIILGDNGYIAGNRAETHISSIFRGTNEKKVAIFHGYPDFMTKGSGMVKEVYTGGCIVTPTPPQLRRLLSVAEKMGIELTYSLPYKGDVGPEEAVNTLMPYIHTYSAERIRRARNLPLTLGDIRIEEPQDTMPPTLSWGQRKLLLTEIDFLTRYIQRGYTILYVGGAPGDHIPLLSTLFFKYRPKIHVYDEGPFNIESGRGVTLHPDLFSDELAQEYAGRDDILLISDIRRGREHIRDDMDFRRRWVDIIRPIAALLKFKLTEDMGPKYEYLDGTLLLQPWTRSLGGETRLMIGKDPGTRRYDVDEYLEKMKTFNEVVRMSSYTPYNVDKELGMCSCYDCTLEQDIIKRYRETILQKQDGVLRTSKYISDNLKGDLWMHRYPKGGSDDRDIKMVDDPSSPEIMYSMHQISTLIVNGDEDTKDEDTPYIDPGPDVILRRIYRDNVEPTVAVNFHKDFIKDYDPSRDIGTAGRAWYNNYLQSLHMLPDRLSPTQSLAIFILSKGVV